MNAIGFDLGSHSLKLVELAKDGKKFSPVRISQHPHPFGVMVPQGKDQIAQLADIIKKAFVEKGYGTKNVRIALPESVLSTKIISTPPLSDAELASAIDWLAEQHIAIPLDQLKLEYEVLYRPDNRNKEESMRVMLIGVPKVVISAYVSLFESLEIEPVVMETQLLSLLRSLGSDGMPTTLYVHMGAQSTDFFLVHQGEVIFVYSFANGGRLLTRSIERGLSVDAKEAEGSKISYGVDPNFLDGKVATILSPVLGIFVAEIQKALQFFTNQYGTQTVKRIVFSGGGAHLPGLVGYMSSQLSAECVLAHPFEKLQVDTRVPVPMDQEAAFSVAVGLAMREI